MPEALWVIADDLTGACDIGAELLPLGAPVVVRDVARRVSESAACLSVCNTASRGCDVPDAVARVREALHGLPPGWRGIVVKKIDTALRGAIGAELAATMAQVGAPEAFVLPAIPAVGRTTVGGIQRLSGVPLADTPFARDPLHPITQSSVLAVLEREALLEARLLPLETVRAARWGEHWDEATRPRAVVCDAETDEDVEAALGVILQRPRPLVLAGSIGLGRALARRLGGRGTYTPPEPSGWTPAGPAGVLAAVGSIHPASRAQLRAAEREIGLDLVEVREADGVEAAAVRAARSIERGAAAGLVTPTARLRVPHALCDHLAEAVAACLRMVAPAGLVLVGGEAAQAVLARLDHPLLRVEARPAPLVVRGRLLDGPRPALPIVTKGGSAGDAEMVIRMIRCFDGEGWR